MNEREAAPDEALAGLAREGDEAAFRALVDRYRDRLLATARRGIPPEIRARVAASDVVQECVLAAHARLADFEDRGPGSFGRWMRAFLENKVRDQVRNHLLTGRRTARRDVRPPSGAEGRPFEDHAPSPGTFLLAREERDLADAALGTLPEDQQTILRLVHQGGLPIPEAAEQMGRSVDATRKLYARGVASLGKALRARRGGT